MRSEQACCAFFGRRIVRWQPVGVRILVVDDEARLAAAVRRGLEAEGFAIDVAARGDDALWLATEHAFDLIVLDLMLPGLNGFQVCERLRAAGNWTPILMLTAKEGELDEAEALDTGADDYLTKPFAFVVLLARIRALLRRQAARRPAVLTVADLTLDPSRHICARGGTPLALTAREFALLEFLMRRPGQVASKSEILDHVWDSAFAGDLNVVEVHISALRRKIDTPFGRRTIETVRGVGYRMSDVA
jgi:DNA-binding response OmpR family regulator